MIVCVLFQASKDVVDLFLTLFDHFLLVPGISQLLRHLVAFKRFKLRSLRRYLHVFLDQLIASGEILLSALQTPTHYMVNLAVQRLLDLSIILLGTFAFLNRPRFSFNGPEGARVLDDGVFLLLPVLSITMLHLLLPVLSILPLALLFVEEFLLLLLVVLFDLVLELLLLANQVVNLSRQAVFDDHVLVFVRAGLDWVIFEQAESVHAHV